MNNQILFQVYLFTIFASPAVWLLVTQLPEHNKKAIPNQQALETRLIAKYKTFAASFFLFLSSLCLLIIQPINLEISFAATLLLVTGLIGLFSSWSNFNQVISTHQIIAS